MDIRIIHYNSREYQEMIALRISQLLEPIGVPASYISIEQEQKDLHIGAFENNTIIGCCVLTPRDQATVQLRQMIVRSDYRGNKIGAAIVEFAEKVAKENNFSTLMMHARDTVIDFYKKMDYKISGEQFFEVGIAHHKMQKQLL